jgi:hypothetical protein
MVLSPKKRRKRKKKRKEKKTLGNHGCGLFSEFVSHTNTYRKNANFLFGMKKGKLNQHFLFFSSTICQILLPKGTHLKTI